MNTPTEGISVQVDHRTKPSPWPDVATQAGRAAVAAWGLAAQQYPGIALTGVVLHVGLDEFGPGLHEVVLEVVA